MDLSPRRLPLQNGDGEAEIELWLGKGALEKDLLSERLSIVQYQPVWTPRMALPFLT